MARLYADEQFPRLETGECGLLSGGRKSLRRAPK